MRNTLAASVLVTTLGLATAARAQMGVTAKAGLLMTKIAGDNDDGVENKMGLAIGGAYAMKMGDALTIEPGVLFAMKGAKFEGADDSLSLNYIEIPVLAKYAFAMESFTPYVFGGPALGLLLTAKFGDVDQKDNTKKLDLGLTLGAGASFGAFAAELGYNVGLMNINDAEGGGDSKNRALMLLAGYSF